MAEHTQVPAGREGSLAAPTRHPIDWRKPRLLQRGVAVKELERVLRPLPWLPALPSALQLVSAAVRRDRRVAHGRARRRGQGGLTGKSWTTATCATCCYMTKCPYVPPHPWNIDFPHLMLRAKAVHFRKEGAPLAQQGAHRHGPRRIHRRIPVVSQIVNA